MADLHSGKSVSDTYGPSRRPPLRKLFRGDEPAVDGDRDRLIPLIPRFSDLRELNSWFAFVGQFVADFRTTGSVIPSSPQLSREMIRPVFHTPPKVVVEFGPGTGPITGRILEELAADGTLYSFEINPKFVDYLERHYRDSRLRVMEMGAERLPEVLAKEGHQSTDAVVSSLPLSFFPADLRDAVLSSAAQSLKSGGVFTQFQYASGLDCSGRFPKPYELRPLLQRHFARVERQLVWRNFPPAWVYHCYTSDFS